MENETKNNYAKGPFRFKRVLIQIIIFTVLVLLTGVFPPIIIIPLSWGGYIIIRFGRIYRKKWLIIIGGSMMSLAIATLSVIVWLVLAYIEDIDLHECQSNMRGICYAINEYRQDHDNRYPPSLEVLTEDNNLVNNYLKCPCDKTDDLSSYMYFYTEPEPADPANVVLLLEKSGHHKNNIGGVVFISGNILFIKNVNDLLTQLNNENKAINTKLKYTEHKFTQTLSSGYHHNFDWD